MRLLLLCPFLALVLPSIAESQSRFTDVQACETAPRSVGVGASVEALPSAMRPPSQSNLLGNGGFESWSQGTNPGPFGGSLAPDLWVPMGDSSGTFDQTAILIERSPALGDSAGPPWDAELTSIDVGSFLSQTMENGGEFRRMWLTFSVDIRTGSAAQPTIEIDDGISQTSFSELVVASADPTRFTVRHQVAATAKQVVFRIYPGQVIEVDNAMAIVGQYPRADFVPRPNPEPVSWSCLSARSSTGTASHRVSPCLKALRSAMVRPWAMLLRRSSAWLRSTWRTDSCSASRRPARSARAADQRA